MPDEPVTHIWRYALPWRNEGTMTECGLDGTSYPTMTTEEASDRFKRLGRTRFTMITCVTCLQTTERYWRSDPTERLVVAVQRAIERRSRDDRAAGRPLIVDELAAIAAIVEAHRDEFDELLRARAEIPRLSDRRKLRARTE